MEVIGLVGRKGSGKSFAAAYLRGQGFEEHTMVEPLRTAVQALFKLSDADCDDPARKEQPGPMGVSYRRGMQVVGTDVVRQQFGQLFPELPPGESFWVRHMRARLADARRRGARVVVSDVRFPDEAALIHEFGGRLIAIERPREQRAALAAAGGWNLDDVHASETGVDIIRMAVMGDGDATAQNNGVPADFYRAIDAARR